METNAFSVQKYESGHKQAWDQFIDTSKNATFLFKRDFMDYHSDRFDDYSLMIYKKDKLYAVVPANRKEDVLYSHQGLTYGGLIAKSTNTATVELLLNAVIDYLKSKSFKAIYIKIMPCFLQTEYHSALEYFMFQKKASLVRRDLNFVVDLSKKLKLSNSKRAKPNSEKAKSLKIGISNDLKPFWEEVLIPALADTYGTKPVHSLAEIQMLKERFPKKILQYYAYNEAEIIAGMLLFVDNGVVKSQYTASTQKGKSLRAVDYLYLKLLMKYQDEGFRYFDMGTSNIEDGWNYNKGLTRYKEEFGAYSVNMDCYKLNLI